MAGLVTLHRAHDRTGAGVRRAQAVEMALEMALDLPFGLLEEAEVPGVAELARGVADRERARVPERIEEARPYPELRDALLGAREVVFLLARRPLERSFELRVIRRQRLALVERLGADLTAVVHAHQRRSFLSLRGRKRHRIGVAARNRSRCARCARERPQPPVELD